MNDMQIRWSLLDYDPWISRLSGVQLEICCQLINGGPLPAEDMELYEGFDTLRSAGIIGQAIGKPPGWVEFDPVQFNHLSNLQ